MNTSLRIGAAIVAVLLLTTTAQARGSCDGFHRCRCGVTAAGNFGIPYDYQGMNLKRAAVWRQFQHTSFGAGVAAVRPDGHHVAKVVGGGSCSSAQIQDETGTYSRNICGWTFVSPGGGGGGFTVEASAEPRHQRHHHGRRHHRHEYQQVATGGGDGWSHAH